MNKELYLHHLNTILDAIARISESSPLKTQAIEAFRKILIASLSNTDLIVVEVKKLSSELLAIFSKPTARYSFEDSSNFTKVITCTGKFNQYAKSVNLAEDYQQVKECLRLSSSRLQQIGIQVDLLIYAVEQPSVQAAMEVGQVVEALSEEEQTILASILGINPDDGLPYFLAAQRQIVIDYIRARLCFAKAVSLSEAARIAQNKYLQLIQRITVHHISLNAENNTPTLFSKINDACSIIGEVAKRSFIIEVISGYPIAELQSLDKSRFTCVYNAAVNIHRSLSAVNEMIKYFIQEAKLTGDIPTVQFIADFAGDLTLGDIRFMMCVPDLPMGYTLHNMLLISEQVATGETRREPYSYQTKIFINKTELANLKKYLAELKTWHVDFTAILSCLFGNTGMVRQYTKTGQKPLTEIIRIEQVRRRQEAWPLISSRTLTMLQSIVNGHLRPVLLIGQFALDLTEHPDRDNMREFFQSLYAKRGLKDAKGDVKTFIQADGYEYTSLLSLPNIEAIFDDIMAQAELTFIAQEMGFLSVFNQDLLQVTGAGRLIELYNQQLLAKLQELPIFPLTATGQLNDSASMKVLVRQIATNEGFNTDGNEDFSRLRRHFDTRLQSMLNRLCSIIFHVVDDPANSLSPDEHEELKRLVWMRASALPRSISKNDLLAERRRSLLSDASRRAGHAVIQTLDDIRHLFITFKACEPYAALCILYEEHLQAMRGQGILCDDLTTVLNIFESELIRRMTDEISTASAQVEYYGYTSFDLIKDILLQSFSTMYYQEKTGVTTPSMVKYFLTIAELATTDSQGNRDMSGCDRGFAGRVAAAAVCLVVKGQDPLKDIEVAFRRRLVEDVANRVLRQGAESSMKFANLPYIMHELGLGAMPAVHVDHRKDHVIQEYMTLFATVYTPAALYVEYYQAMINNFKAYTVDEPTEEDITNLYKLFQMLGFTSHREGEISPEDKVLLDCQFRIDPENNESKWSVSKFTSRLPGKLIETLILKRLLTPDYDKVQQGQVLVTALGHHFKNQRTAQPAMGIPLSRGPRGGGPPAQPATRAPSYGGLFSGVGFGDPPSPPREPGGGGTASFFPAPRGQEDAPASNRAGGVAPSDEVQRVSESELTKDASKTTSS